MTPSVGRAGARTHRLPPSFGRSSASYEVAVRPPGVTLTVGDWDGALTDELAPERAIQFARQVLARSLRIMSPRATCYGRGGTKYVVSGGDQPLVGVTARRGDVVIDDELHIAQALRLAYHLLLAAEAILCDA